MKAILARIFCACVLYTPALFAAEVEAPRRFAAPDLTTAAQPGSAGGIGQVMLGLVVVLAAVFGAALLFKRWRGFTGGGSNGIEVLAHASVGSKERVVIVRVAGSRLLLGVATGQVSLLQTLPPEAPANSPQEPTPPIAPLTPKFAELLRRSLGK